MKKIPRTPQIHNTINSIRAVACIRFARVWHRAWALYHSLENHAACRRGDLSAALTHAEKELMHIAKTPLLPICSAWRLLTSVKFHAAHFNWLWRDEAIIVFGAAGGRVNCEPEAKWLYSLRLFLGPCKIEILWRSGEPNNQTEATASK